MSKNAPKIPRRGKSRGGSKTNFSLKCPLNISKKCQYLKKIVTKAFFVMVNKKQKPWQNPPPPFGHRVKEVHTSPIVKDVYSVNIKITSVMFCP